jgi:hypothetical protein
VRWVERWANFGGNERKLKWAAPGVGPKSRLGCRIDISNFDLRFRIQIKSGLNIFK